MRARIRRESARGNGIRIPELPDEAELPRVRCSRIRAEDFFSRETPPSYPVEIDLDACELVAQFAEPVPDVVSNISRSQLFGLQWTERAPDGRAAMLSSNRSWARHISHAGETAPVALDRIWNPPHPDVAFRTFVECREDWQTRLRMVADESWHQPILWVQGTGVVTPFHYDRDCRLLLQLYGRKHLSFIAPEPGLQMLSPFEPEDRVGCHATRLGIDLDARARWLGDPVAAPVVFELETRPGTLVYRPPYWWHQVEALTTSICATQMRLVTENETRHPLHDRLQREFSKTIS